MSSSADDPVASEALAALLGLLGGSRGVLFEAGIPVEGAFGATAVIGCVVPAGLSLEFAWGSLLPRWLRVNREALSIPDRVGVFDALSPPEQSVLRGVAASAVIPLLVDDNLIAWAAVTEPLDLASVGPDHASGIGVVAGRLLSARTAAQERARDLAVARANKLSLAGQMAAGIAHEVRNPLAAVRSIVQLVKQGAVPASQQGRLLGNVIEEIDRVNGVVTSLLAMGRTTTARDEPLDVMALVAEAAEFCGPYARDRGQTITIDAASSGALWVCGNAHELRQVVVNLLLNACQASRDEQMIVVSGQPAEDASGHAIGVLQVRDYGSGIPAAALPHVFDSFFTTKIDGGGLGLSLCRDVMRYHGGSIAIASEPGHGTIVTLELPLEGPRGAHPGR